MKLHTLAISAATLMLAVGVANAQDAAATPTMSSSTMGALCSDLNAMEAGSQTAFLQGYEAGMRDAGNGMLGTSSETTTQFGNDGSLPAPDASGNPDANTTTAADANAASTDTTATDANAASTDTMASTDTAMSSDSMSGTTDYATIVTSCAGAPNSTISSFMSTGMPSTTSTK